MAFNKTVIKYSSNRPGFLGDVLTALLYRAFGCLIANRVEILFSLALLFSVPAIAAVPNDFDRDGVSDITRVEIESDGTLTWKAVLSTNGSSTTLGMLGQEGNQLAMAQWLGAGTQIGIVSEEKGGDGIVWSIIDSSGTRINRVFGRKGDLVISGGDFDGNGVADAAVARLFNGRVEWEVAFDLFVSAEP
jgi:hypothetical protein